MVFIMKKRITVEEIAKLSNASKTTVSRVLTGKGYVAKEKADVIKKIAQELGYKPYRKRSENIQDMVMVISCQLESEAQVVLSNAIRERLYEFGIKTVIAPVEFNSDAIYGYLEYATEKKFGGIISLGALETPQFCNALRSCLCPIVLLNQSIEGLDATNVIMNDYAGAYEATEYLLSKGHKKILYLTGYESATAIEDRERGFYDAMSDQGFLYSDISVRYTDFSKDSSEQFVDELISSGVGYTAIIASTDVITKGILETFKKRNIRIPEEISIISFGNNDVTRFYDPSISVVDYDFRNMGVSMANLLLKRKGYISNVSIKTKFDPKLIIRDSVLDLNHQINIV